MRDIRKIATGLMILSSLTGNKSYSQDGNFVSRSLNITIDNDYLNYRGRGTDRYYTNGMGIEYSHLTKKKKFFGARLLVNTGNDSINIAHWSITQLMFTPDNICNPNILYNNRPYAGALFLSRGRTSFSKDMDLSIHSEINIGLIGPFSFAKDAQIWVHKAINYSKPEGWNNQIKTDIVLNYNIDVIKQVLKYRNVQVDLKLASRAGTLYNDIGVGFGLRAGKLLPYFHSNNHIFPVQKKNKKNASEIYFYSSGQLKLVLGNSLLQGGFIQSFKNGCADFYHIEDDDMKHLVSSYETGIVFNRLKWGISFSQHFISAEFKAAKAQLFGRLGITYRFN